MTEHGAPVSTDAKARSQLLLLLLQHAVSTVTAAAPLASSSFGGGRNPPKKKQKQKLETPREVWISGTGAQHCSSSVWTLVPDHPSVSAPSVPPPLHPLPGCIPWPLCMGGEGRSGCRSACSSGVIGQPGAHDMLRTSAPPLRTDERLQTRLVRNTNLEQSL